MLPRGRRDPLLLLYGLERGLFRRLLGRLTLQIRLRGWRWFHRAPVYLVCFDVASTSAVTLGTSVPAFVVPYPQSNGTAANGTADRLGLPAGVTFQNGLVIAAVTSPVGSTLSTNGLTGSLLWH